MKKAISIFLLSLFLFNILGYYIVFKAAQYQIQTEVYKNVRLKELTTLIISKKDISAVEWLKQGKEFRYKGDMYDIVSSEETNEKITFRCIKDDKEKHLAEVLEGHIDSHVASDQPGQNKSSKNLTNHLIKFYFSPTIPVMHSVNCSSIIYTYKELSYSDTFLKITSPPPEIA